ncbi:DUF6350 family protein [Corynebacterium sp. Marseille-P3884]|uniref:cell division protein PerM n=1 Tax=Corynebacterium sp. Marseille-P3884 TaxID=2495409 RepID=UPI001B33DCF5|nr:DUF6350 family protein [Corynebacterium sp. Marseille-P3884]MBP3948164.1 hypothetical protein [Corynebacterium sp. Marseille-P3884]
MSKKSSPPSRSTGTAPSISRRRARAERNDAANRTPATEQAPTTMKERVRHYLPYVGVPNLVVVLGIVVVCLGTILLTGGRLAALPSSIAELWFVLHGVPVSFQGVTLGAMPLAPVIGVAALIAWRVRAATRERVSILDLYVIFGLVVLIPFTLSAVAWFMVEDATAVFPLAPPALHKALLIPVVVHLAGMACGMSGRLWKALLARLGAPDSLYDAARAIVRLCLRLLAAAAVVYLIFLALGFGRINELLGEFPTLGAGGGFALVALSLLYLPNAAVSTLAVLLGAPFDIAQGGVSLFGAALVPLPPFPLFAAIPGDVPVWAPVLLVIPAAVMIHFVLSRRLVGLGIVFAAALAAAFAAVAGLMSGGEVGAYGWVGPNPWFFALAAALWTALISGAAWLVAYFMQTRNEEKLEEEEKPEEEEPEEEPEPEVIEAEEEPGEEAEEAEPEVIEAEEPEEAEGSEETEEPEDEGDVDKPAASGGGSTAISVKSEEQLD